MTFRTAAAWQPLERRIVNGPTMGTRFSAVFYAPAAADLDAIGKALGQSVAEVDDQMSTWKPDSDLIRFNRAEVGEWVALPPRLLAVMTAGLEIGRASDGAFDIGVLDLVAAYGFGTHGGLPDAGAVERITVTPRLAAHESIEIDLQHGRAIKHNPISIDLSGIAKGYGVDRLAETLEGFGIAHYLVSIDGELRASGGKADGSPWRVAVEQPDPNRRDVAGVVELTEGALATSGNYRHRRELDGRSFAHTMDPRTGLPATDAIHSATVRAATCMEADAWATVVLVLGEERAEQLLSARGLQAMVIAPEAATPGQAA